MEKISEGQQIGGYTVSNIVKTSRYSDTYRADDDNGDMYLLRVFDPDETPSSLREESGEICEVAVCRALKKNDRLPFVANGTTKIAGKRCPYVVTRFYGGMILADALLHNEKMGSEWAFKHFEELLYELYALHELGYIHNDIQPRNVIISDASVHIIDFSHISKPCDGVVPFSTGDLNLLYQATETLWKTYSTASDIYSITAVFYAMLYGHAPWETALPSPDDPDFRKKTRAILHEKRRENLDLSDTKVRLTPAMKAALENGLAQKAVLRTKDAKHMLNLIHQYDSTEDDDDWKSLLEDWKGKPDQKETEEETEQEKEDTTISEEEAENYRVPDGVKATGRGFADVAGLDSLKNMLQKKVIFLLRNKELAQRYKLTPPNGMLLYGPPGCGKTYFAEKFAEESGFNFHFVKASDLGSTYVHGTQGKIAELFRKAAANAPSVICFDEFDAMVPQRDADTTTNSSARGEVNEFLTQLSNCSSRGLFVIGTTNKPDLIDQAVLRKGRLDLQVYIPAPDEATRKLMFELYLNGRPCGDIDTTELARMTENYVSSDIAYIVNDAAMIAAFADEPITQDKIEKSIRSTQPSFGSESLHYYEKMRSRFESRSSQRRPMGFAVACGS